MNQLLVDTNIGHFAFIEDGRPFVMPIAFAHTDGDDKLAALELVTDGLLPGRIPEVRAHHRKELAATLLLRLRIDEWTFKNSAAWPEDPDDDIATDTWAGVLPIVTTYGDPLNAPDLRERIPLSPSVERLSGTRRVSQWASV